MNCLEHTVDRQFDTAHLSVTCQSCGSFERFVNEAVFQQFEAFESSPPPTFDWERLNRTEKFVVAERLVRSTKTLDDFEVVDGEPTHGESQTADEGSGVAADDETSEEPAGKGSTGEESTGEGSTGEGSTGGESTDEIAAKGTDGEAA